MGRAAHEGRCGLTFRSRPRRYFPLPNELFHLELNAGEISVYAYLLYCEDRRTYQCYPSYRTIGSAVHMSENTVRKYVASLEEKRLISTEPTTIRTRDGRRKNGSLRYTIRPIQEAVDYYHERQMVKLEAAAEAQHLREQVEQYDKKRGISGK